MLSSLLRLVLCGALLTCSASGSAPDEPGFEPLFPAHDFTGWHGALENYQWQEDVLSCRATKGGNIYSDDDYADFVLRFEFRLTAGGNNGIGVRVPDSGHASTQGMEIQIIDETSPKHANLKPYQAHGSVYGVIPAERVELKPVGEWNSQEISCIGRRVKVVVNGTTVVDGDLDEAMRDGTADGKEHPGALRATGRLCFCTHGSVVDFRNLRIMRCSPTP
jgi:hypothetical protein